MFYYIYKITNNINNKIYIGVHSTKNLNDGYMGSGTLLKIDKAKYGTENFTKEILEFFDDAKSMFKAEEAIVNKEFLLRDDVYNLKLGGAGKWYYINTPETILKKKEAGIKGGEVFKARFNKDFKLQERYKRIASKRLKLLWKNPEIRQKFIENTRETWTGRKHSDETISKMKNTHNKNKHQQGKSNSSYGTMWIYSPEEKISKKIQKSSEIPEGWIKGRKFKF